MFFYSDILDLYFVTNWQAAKNGGSLDELESTREILIKISLKRYYIVNSLKR